MDITKLLQMTDEYYGSILRHVDVTLKNPVHQRAARRIMCSWITGGGDSIYTIMDEVEGFNIDESMAEIGLALYHFHTWVIFEGVQYKDNAFHVNRMRPVFDDCGLGELFDCCVVCMQRVHATCCIDDDYGARVSHLSDDKALAVKNKVRAMADLPLSTKCQKYEVMTYNHVVMKYICRKWRNTMLWKRLREYVRCVHHIKAGRSSETRDVMSLVVDMLEL